MIDGAGEPKSLAVIQGTLLGRWLIQMESGSLQWSKPVPIHPVVIERRDVLIAHFRLDA